MDIIFSNAVAIEFAEDTDLQFIKKNVLFAFDAIELERTTEFDIPETAFNNAVFGLAKWPQAHGDKMRQRFPVQLQCGAVIKNGFLYISSYADGVYKAVFVTGQLLGLKAIKEAGKLKDVYNGLHDTKIEWPPSYIHSADDDEQWDWEYYNYLQNKGEKSPSVNLQGVLVRLLLKLGYQINTSNVPEVYRVIPQLQGMDFRPFTIERTIVGVPQATEATAVNLCDTTINDMLLPYCKNDQITPIHYQLYTEDEQGYNFVSRYAKVAHFSFNLPAKIKFDEDFPDNIFIGEFDDTVTTNHFINGFKFIGGYELDNLSYTEGEYDEDGNPKVNFTTSGARLAGRTISLEKNKPFIFVSVWDAMGDFADIIRDNKRRFVPSRYTMEDGTIVSTLDVPLNVSFEFDEEETQPLFLKDNLPDTDIVSCAKSIATMAGLLLMWDEEREILYYETGNDLEQWDVIKLPPVAVGEMSRTFSDYAQHNKIYFESSSNVVDADKIVRDYTIENVNIEESKELLKIPFSEASYSVDSSGLNLLYLDNGREEADKPSIGIAGADSGCNDYMLRAKLPAVDLIRELCEDSTRIKVDFVCSLIEYEQINFKTLIYHQGVEYVWTELQWKNGIMSAELSKISRNE